MTKKLNPYKQSKEFTMKTIFFAFIIITLSLINFSCQSDSKKYLELSESQLRDIGFVINERGIFFKSEVPENTKEGIFHCMVGYINTNDDQGTRMILAPARQNLGKIVKENADYFDSLPVLKSDYYFAKIIEVSGENIYTSFWKKIVTIPILVKQTKYNFKIKKDVIVYMKASEGLKKKLSYVENLEKYFVTLSEK
ncbi:MAG: hypothetical protein A2X61_07150 [Ignavibacteria bacterium GWB2_35_12]|nr:MAG: hypothetical protein A2X63_06165 [Ignavibacteria bacterium GWA2_35_8]OGU39254.1 MAG: hypothetical protein A2X61_07150 [Ignavibacteria bacterium GWB2_35_12]OGU88673.1 MAG: hypothetical protein A2220_00460 [Ignavibacteria bacterium RIFOXYA2_FULL_35_10]OGV23245.1 MAG: hypothetical protein A2475_13405 [Ignavibacteria bacterium RIFOXYC2_FULL_35_21]